MYVGCTYKYVISLILCHQFFKTNWKARKCYVDYPLLTRKARDGCAFRCIQTGLLIGSLQSRCKHQDETETFSSSISGVIVAKDLRHDVSRLLNHVMAILLSSYITTLFQPTTSATSAVAICGDLREIVTLFSTLPLTGNFVVSYALPIAV